MRFPYIQERSKFLPIISLQIKSKVKVDWIIFERFKVCFDEKEKVVEFI